MPPKQSAAAAVAVVERQPPTPPATDHGTDAATFGAFLRGQRERRQLTLQQIAAITKIAPHHFNALERGDVARWPYGMYRRAMIRAYARAIGLDAEETVRTFVQVFSDEYDGPPVAPHATGERHARAVIRRSALAAAVVGAAAAVLLMGWYAAAYIRGAMQSDAISTPQPVPAGANKVVETSRPALSDRMAMTSTQAATAGITNEPVSGVGTLTEGELRVASDPDGAQVTVNGIGWGRTPVTIKYLPMGEKWVRLTKDGYMSTERRIQITAERPLRSLRVTLQSRADD